MRSPLTPCAVRFACSLSRYEDGDREHLTLDELRQHLVDPAGCQRRLEEAVAAEAGAGPDENDENEQGARNVPAQKRQRTGGVLRDATDRSRNAVPAPGEERRSRWVLRAAGLGNATDGWGCAVRPACTTAWPACQELVWLAALVITMPRLVPSFLPRRREVKRRHDADYEYEEHPGAKRGPAAAGAAGHRSRFGIRPPAAAAALAAACPVSESEVGGCASSAVQRGWGTVALPATYAAVYSAVGSERCLAVDAAPFTAHCTALHHSRSLHQQRNPARH